MRLAEVSEVRHSSGARWCRWILLGPWLPRFPTFGLFLRLLLLWWACLGYKMRMACGFVLVLTGFWFAPPAFVTVVGYFGLQNVGEVYGSRRTYGCVLRLAM